MQIKLANKYGFCLGVKRALRIAENLSGSSGNKIQTFGALIHNPRELKRLKAKGIIEINQISKVNEKLPIVIRAHGISPAVEAKLRKKAAKTIDATCPLVKKTHGIVAMLAKNGYSIVILGEINHPEIRGILGHTNKNAVVVNNCKEAEKIDIKADKIALLVQSTEIPEEFDKIGRLLKKKYPDIRIFDTLCNPTKLAKEAAMKLARESDLMIVIGGKNSSNTKKLTQVCSKCCRTIQIEDAKELNKKMLRNANKIGITAGASTPGYIVKEVINKLKRIENEVLH